MEVFLKVPFQKNQLLWVFLLLLVAVSVGFFLPISRSGWLGYFGKGILFLFVFLVFYAFFFVPARMSVLRTRGDRKVEDSSTEVAPEEVFQEGTWKGFGEAFRWYYQELLTVVRNAVAASSAGLYLKKGREGLEFQAGENDRERVDRRVWVAEGDLVDRVAKQKTPLSEANLPVGTTLEGMAGSEIRSFLGVPLVWEDGVVGVLAVGSEATESFGEDDQELLVRCGGLVAQVMAVYHRGLRWELDQEVYRVYLDLEKTLLHTGDEESAVFHFVQHIRKLFPFDRFTLCVKEGNEGSIRYVHGLVGDSDRGMRFSLDEGLNGWILKRNAPLLIPDMEEGDCIRPRYFRGEDSKHELRSFLGIPLGKEEDVWGCFSLESKGVDQYSEKGKEVLTTLAVPLQSAIERIHLIQQLQGLKQGGNSSDSTRFEMD